MVAVKPDNRLVCLIGKPHKAILVLRNAT